MVLIGDVVLWMLKQTCKLLLPILLIVCAVVLWRLFLKPMAQAWEEMGSLGEIIAREIKAQADIEEVKRNKHDYETGRAQAQPSRLRLITRYRYDSESAARVKAYEIQLAALNGELEALEAARRSLESGFTTTQRIIIETFRDWWIYGLTVGLVLVITSHLNKVIIYFLITPNLRHFRPITFLGCCLDSTALRRRF